MTTPEEQRQEAIRLITESQEMQKIISRIPWAEEKIAKILVGALDNDTPASKSLRTEDTRLLISALISKSEVFQILVEMGLQSVLKHLSGIIAATYILGYTTRMMEEER